MKKLLVCTICRNVAPHVSKWSDLVSQLATTLFMLDGWETSVSIVENDSVDGTDRGVREIQKQWSQTHSPVEQVWLATDKLGTTQYPSVWSIDRLRNLAAARQRCLDRVGDLSRFAKIAYIEVDCTWDPVWCKELVLAEHPRAAGIGEPDIYSGWSLRSLAHPKESTFLYDDCATRAGPDDIRWDIGEANGTWRGKSLVPTGLTGFHANSLHSVWSTFNGFCVYSAKPFIEGARWGYINRRIDPSGIWLDSEKAWLEADTVAICETFRARGHANILLNTNCLIRHA